MHNAEISIRQDIANLTKDRLAPITQAIRTDMKYAFWNGFIDEYIYKNLEEELQKKRDSLFE